MPGQPLHRLPDEAPVALQEIRRLVGRLERLQRTLYRRGAAEEVDALDDAIGQVLRWLWPLLDELDDEGDVA